MKKILDLNAKELTRQEMKSISGGKFWGKETTRVRDFADGECAYRITYYDKYVLGIRVGSGEHRETIACI